MFSPPLMRDTYSAPHWFGPKTNIGNQCLFSPSIIDDNDNNDYCPYRDDR